ncbi:uncharacterized protein LOC135370977 isoform X2 [Ornithodoros turicata]|uniref:uncharacterized protein LOC135370977 isoform X2 n=1 Tax=Ornithodoros turicata TaxID=34597 RepID=UPI0031398008
MRKQVPKTHYEYVAFLMPIYMLPMLYGGKEGICIYCVMLPLVWFAFNCIPRPLVAFLHVVTLPAFSIMDPDVLSSAFFSVEVLTVVVFLCVMMVVYSRTTLIPRASFYVCGFFGLQMRYFFVCLFFVTFVCTQFISNGLLAMGLLLALENVLHCIEKQQLRTRNIPEQPDVLGLLDVQDMISGVEASRKRDADVLFEKLSSAVHEFRRRSLLPPNKPGSPIGGAPELPSSPSDVERPASTSTQSKQQAPSREAGATSTPLSDCVSQTGGPPRGLSSPDAPGSGSATAGTPLDSDTKKHNKRKEKTGTSTPPTAVSYSKLQVSRGVSLENENKKRRREATRQYYEASSPSSRRASRASISRGRRRSVLFAQKPLHSERQSEPQDKEYKAEQAYKNCRFSEIALVADHKVSVEESEKRVSPKPGKDGNEPKAKKRKLEAAKKVQGSLRRPSILITRATSTALPDHLPEELEVVDVGNISCHISGDSRRKHRALEGFKKHIKESWGGGKRFSAGHIAFKDGKAALRSPPPFASALGELAMLPPLQEDEQLRRLRKQESRRTVFLVTSTLVTVTGSLASLWTIPARDALHKHFPRDGITIFTWMAVAFPTSFLASLACCIPLFLIHLRESDVPDEDEDQREVCTIAITKLNNLGPYRIVTLVYLCFLMIACAVVPPDVKQPLAQSRHLHWRNFIHNLPWEVILIYGSMQVSSKAVEATRLLPALFESMGNNFWLLNSPLSNQIALAVFGCVLAEIMNNAVLCHLVVPIVLELAYQTKTAPLTYAIPAVVASSSNIILPISLPLVLMHQTLHVDMLHLLMIGFMAKVIIVVTIITSVNTTGKFFFGISARNTSTSAQPTMLALRGAGHLTIS